MNARAFADLMEKYRAVQTRYVQARHAEPTAPPVVEAEQHLSWVRAELGVPAEPMAESQQPPAPRERPSQFGVDWASGYGYVNVSMALHRAEEALFSLRTGASLMRSSYMIASGRRALGSRTWSRRCAELGGGRLPTDEYVRRRGRPLSRSTRPKSRPCGRRSTSFAIHDGMALRARATA